MVARVAEGDVTSPFRPNLPRPLLSNKRQTKQWRGLQADFAIRHNWGR